MVNRIQGLFKSNFALVFASAMVATVSVTLPASAGKPGANLDVTVDANQLSQQIEGAVRSAQNREGCVKNLANVASDLVRQKANVMVFNLNQNFDPRFNGQIFYRSATCAGITYGVWAFRDGEFTNKGDGGYINWAFIGNFKRDGSHVKFYPI